MPVEPPRAAAPSRIYTADVTLSWKDPVSPRVALYATQPVGIITPAAWTDAVLTFQVSADDDDYFDMYTSAGAEYTIPMGPDRYIALDPRDFWGAQYIKLRSGTTLVPVSQAADRDFTLVLRNMGK